MKTIATLVVCFLLLVVSALGLWQVLTSPSCEDRGGKSEFSHFIYIYQPALKMMQMYPVYKCGRPDGT